jgi:uncharacterized protein (TIGR03067 family)
MKSVIAAVALCCLSVPALAANAAAAKDQESLQGTWQVVSFKVEGAQGPPEEVIKTMKLTIKGDKMSHGGAGGRTEEATFTLDATQQPKTLDMTPTAGPDKGKSILGIYQLDGDTLKICAAKPETARPKEFKEGKEAVLLELKREKP